MTLNDILNYEHNKCRIPPRMAQALLDWINKGEVPGHFLQAVLRNDLTSAVARADSENLANLPAYVFFLYNEAPSPCWGSVEKVSAWAAQHSNQKEQLS